MKKITVGNWKMNLNLVDSLALARNYAKEFKDFVGTAVACPTFLALDGVSKILSASPVKVGAQNVFWQPIGAYTGEVGPADLKNCGCTYVIIGHSERRQWLGETDQMVNQKAKAALAANLTPIICIGETLQQNEQDERENVLINQLRQALEGLSLNNNQQLIIAYEPIWAIGTGRAISTQDADEIHGFIKAYLRKIMSSAAESNLHLLYGGSVTANNAAELARLSSVDGALVGGASLNATEFLRIAQAFNR